MSNLLLERKSSVVGFTHQWNLETSVMTVFTTNFLFHALALKTSVHLSLLLLILSRKHTWGYWEWHCSLYTAFSEAQRNIAWGARISILQLLLLLTLLFTSTFINIWFGSLIRRDSCDMYSRVKAHHVPFGRG